MTGSHLWAWEAAPRVAPYVDYLAFHTYWREGETGDPWYQIMAAPHDAERMIDALKAVIRMVRRSVPRCRDISIACTEWNVSPRGGMMGNHPEYNPFRPTYHLRDALAVASFINIMQRHCREVRLATVAQSINVVGLIMVKQEGVWREPVYWPLWMQVHHSGPIALDAWLKCETFDEPGRNLAGMPYLDCSVTLDPRRRKLYLSMVNRHREDAVEIKVDISEAAVSSHGRVHLLYHDDPMAKNSPADPDNVRARSESVDGLASHFTWELKPHSYAILELDLG